MNAFQHWKLHVANYASSPAVQRGPTRMISGLAVISTAILMSASVQAASVSQVDLDSLRKEATRLGAAAVIVHLHRSTFEQLKSDRAGLSLAASQKAQSLYAELREAALTNGRWSNGAGQVGMYVTSQGIDRLIASSTAISFFAGGGWKERTTLAGYDGSHRAIEEALARGYVDVDVLANVDGLEIQHRPDGRFSYSASTREARGAVTKLLNIVTGSSELEIADRTAVLSSLTQRLASTGAVSPAVSMRLTLEGLLKLSVDDSIRRMRTAGYVDPRALEIDSGAFDAAARLGEASVILTIRDAHAGGRLSAASQAALQRSNRAAANAVLASSRVGVIKQDFSRFGAVAANLNLEELNRLRASADPRLLSIELNRPVAVPNLATSGPTMNVASAHNAGYVASGQGIIVFDGGMQVDHPFFGNRVVFQACFGTSENIDGINYTSVCPDGNAGNNWDSPPGTPNAAAPVFPFYNHGTHVAGIAAGNQSPPTALRGTGPAANIYAVQLFSRLEGTSEPRVLNQDLLAALQLAASSLPSLPQPQRQPFTLTMSFGAGLFVVPCSLLAAYSTAVASLRTAGVPVLASTGNDGFDYGINFPACLPGVIKVSSVANDGVGNTRSTFGGPRAANTADPSAFPQQTFWFAPGGGNGTGVTSSILAGQFGNDAGTSMAAPQMAGLYAAAKSAVPEWTETDITAYFVANASVSVPVVIGGTTAFSYRRISLPAY